MSRVLPPALDAASQLICDIRANHGFDDDQLSHPAPAVLELRGKLGRALERLSSDLYNKKTHFLLEFIQNADDNTYRDNVTPTLHLRVEDRLVVFSCNELGFSEANVKAICDIGGSTKTGERTRGFIGEKGIGFKSVFTVANQVHISSGPYSFSFDKTAPLGMITPALSSQYPTRPGWTTFHLHLAPSENGNELSMQLRDVRPTLLLFLRKLRALSITVPRAAQHGATEIEVRRTDGPDDNMVSLERIEDDEHKIEKYILVGHLAQTLTQEPAREGVTESEVVLAFPVTDSQEPVMEPQDVHAFLPLRCYGFNFIIQADFITSASREDVLTHRSWNQALRGSVIDAFLFAVERFADHPTLRNAWFRYLPESIADTFFCYVEHKLLTELQTRQILRSTDGTYARASQLFFLPPSFRDDSGTPLIPEAYLPRGQLYLSPDYDTHRDEHILRRLGVREMTDDDILAGLATMDQKDIFGTQSDAWHDAVATFLLRLPRPPYGAAIRAEVLMLRILPLRNGSWAQAAIARRFTFPPTGVSIPDDLDLQSIASGIAVYSPRYQLFARLGVTPPNPVPIANKILSASGPRSVAARVAHARFFFDYRKEANMPPAMRLRLVDEHSVGAQGDELYLDLPGEDGTLSLRDALSPAARFLHPAYLAAYPESAVDEVDKDEAHGIENGFRDTRSEWHDWLRDHVGINVVPRVVNGHLAPDFLDRAPGLDGHELLVSLRAWWPRLESCLTEAGERALGAVPIAGRRLDTLYLRRRALARADQAFELPCVPVDDPEDRSWDFLSRLGVATRMNASFFVNKLLHLQARGEKDNATVEDIYKQLDARFDEDETLIMNAFKKYPIILVFVNDEAERVWLRKMDVYWHGPPSMTSKAVISRSYPHLSDFFFNKLGITNAPPFALVDELRMIAERHQSGPIPPGVREHVADILADISDVIESMPKLPSSFAALAQIAAFPVQVPAEGIALRAVDGFYVPDKSGKYADVFRERVALLDLPDSTPIARIRPLLESDIFKDKMRYLDSHVTKRFVPEGRRVLDSSATDLYSSRVEYFARLVHHSNRSDIPPKQTEVLAKLRKIKIIGVSSITTTLSLGQCHEPTPEDVAFEDANDKFTVYVSSRLSSGQSIHPFICTELSPLLGVDMITLFSCITLPVDIVNHLFKFQGIEEIPVDDIPDRSWLQTITRPNVPVVPVPVVPEKPPSPAPPPSPPPPRSPTALSVHDEGDFPPLGTEAPKTLRHTPSLSSTSTFRQSPLKGRQRQRSWAHSSVGVSEHSQFVQPSRSPYGPGHLQPAAPMNTTRDMNKLATLMEAFANNHQMVPGAVGGPVWPPFGNFNIPVATDETDMVGIMGEHYVYKLLLRMLDDFRPEHWTSELRNNIPGFAPFQGQAHADFTYPDTHGQLTREWFGPEKAAAWQGRWPRYHIEVKSTRGEENESFHVSRAQMATAYAFSERTHLGSDMYVIVRVSRVGMPEPSYMVYPDPHRGLFLGNLQYASDIYLQRNMEF